MEPGSMDRMLAARSAALVQAQRIHRDGGPERLTVRALAAAIGASTQRVYSLFGGKVGVLDALADAAYADFAAVLDAVPQRLPVRGRLFAIVDAYRRFAQADRHRYLLLFSAQERRDPARSAAALIVLRLRKECAALPSAAEADDVAGALHAAAHGAVLLEFSGILSHERASAILRRSVSAALA